MVNIPKLDRSNRSREYERYTEHERAEVVFEYLFNGSSHRQLDEEVLGVPSSYSRGWQSMGVLHFLGLKDAFKGVFQGQELPLVIAELSSLDEEFKSIAYYLSIYDFGVSNPNDLMLFRQNTDIDPLVKKVGSSQFSDGVRVNKSYHDIFNPPDSKFYTERGSARPIRVLFNNKIFDAVYRYEGQTDKDIELQSIRFQKDLKNEFNLVFPFQLGEFSIAVGRDINHFLFIQPNSDTQDIEDAEGYPEGRASFKKHKSYERNPKVIKKAKSNFWKKQGFYKCEACGFRFDKVYGERGHKFIEGHHIKPVSKMKPGDITLPEDIALLCSNCHRMVHKRPFITVRELAAIINPGNHN